MKKMLDRSLRLKLHRETLRALAVADLADVAGAATTNVCSDGTCYTDCHQFSCRTTC